MKSQSKAITDCIQLAKSTQNDGDETKATLEKQNHLLGTQADQIVTMSSAITTLSTQTTELRNLLQTVLQSQMETFTAVLQFQQLQANMPPQIERQQPILFEDAHGRLAPFHLEFINSFPAFQAVLEVRFAQVPGLKKVKSLEYVMQDTASKKTLDLNKPWESIFRPGRKIIMSMLFQQVSYTQPKAPAVVSCPGCLQEVEDVNNRGHEQDTHTQWCVNTHYPTFISTRPSYWKLT